MRMVTQKDEKLGSIQGNQDQKVTQIDNNMGYCMQGNEEMDRTTMVPPRKCIYNNKMIPDFEKMPDIQKISDSNNMHSI